ncbi:MAG: efflux RND transporter permease subunit [Eubacteriales bacterium]|nr:efflux RND transporter permease subunit [Eubacteriales bacterium]
MSKFSVKKPLTVFMVVIAVVVLGFVSYGKMTPDLLPNIDLPYVVVMTTYPGASPEKVETVISKPMEQSLATLDNVKNIQSVSNSNVSLMIIEFSTGVNMDTVGVDIQQKINLIEGYWDDAVGTPIILKLNPSMLPVAVAAVSMEDMDQRELSAFVDDTLMNKLEGINGIASVSATGLLESKVNVVITQEKIDTANDKIRQSIDAQMEAMMSGGSDIDPAVLAQMMTVDQAQAMGMDLSSLTMQQAMESGVNVLTLTSAEAEEKGLPVIAQELKSMEEAQAMAEGNMEDLYAKTDMNNIITMDMVSGLLQAQNFAMPEGYVAQDGVSYLVSVGDELTSLEDIENLLIMDMGMEGVDPIYLKDVAEVTIIDNAADCYAKINGKDCIVFSFSKQSDFATAKASSNIKDKFDELEKSYEGMKFSMLMDQGDYIYMVINSIIQSLLQAAIFAVIVLFLFLKDWRPTLITLLSIPVSVIFAFVLMYFSGVTLNMISMSALAISVGMLVDNSVVVIENIYRLRSKGVSAVKAAVAGAKQVGGAILASTLTTICVFAPIVFVDGLTRQLFSDLALTLAYALLASLIIAMTLVPAMASGLLKKNTEKKHKLFDIFTNGYKKLLQWSLRFKPIVIVLVIALLVFSVWGVLRRGFTFMPETSMPQISVTAEFPEDATFEEIKTTSDQIMDNILTIKGVDMVGATAGGNDEMSAMMGGSNANKASLYVQLEEETDVSSKEVSDQIMELCKDLDCKITTSSSGMDMSSMGGSGLSLYVYGNDIDELMETSEKIATVLEGIEGTDEVKSGIEETDPEIHIAVDKDAAMREGVTVAQVYMAINEKMSNETAAGSINIDKTEYDCVVIDKEEAAKTPDDIRNMTISVTGQNGIEKELKISDIATIEDTNTLASINRKNQRRFLNVTASIKEGYNVTKINDEAEKAIKNMDLPKGVSVEFSGETEQIMDSMKQLVLMLLLGLLLVYMIMVAQFQSLKSPFIIMFTIPLAFTGGFLALFLTGQELSIISMLGFIMLCGIIVNNGIVLVDYINQLRMEGMDKKEAIVEAGITRIRPILMTSLTTILGLAVMVLGIGNTAQGAELMKPLVIVCIGGLIYATALTLIFVPVLYDLMNKNKMRIVKDEDLAFEEE